MKKSKRILAGIMALSLCFVGSADFMTEGIVPFVAVAESNETVKSGICGDNLTWVLNDEGTLNISGTGDMTNVSWDSEKESIKKVIIENGVTSIGYNAFSDCKGLTSITIPNSVTSIGNGVFCFCSGLTEITILNPKCEIYGNNGTISNGYGGTGFYFNGTICGYDNSTAQAYAEKYNYNFKSFDETPVPELEFGDINSDGLIDSVDATAVRIEYAAISADKDSTMTDAQKKSSDVNGDGFTDSVDATIISMYYAKVSAGGTITFAEFVENNKNA